MEDPIQSAGDPDRAKAREGHLALEACSVSLCFLVTVSEQPPRPHTLMTLMLGPKQRRWQQLTATYRSRGSSEPLLSFGILSERQER